MSAESPILFTIDADGIGTLTLNRPGQLNAFDLPMIDAWRAALESAEADDRVRVIVVTGTGRAFCAGGDFDEMAKFSELDSLGRKNFLYRHVHRIALTLERMEKPVIAHVLGRHAPPGKRMGHAGALIGRDEESAPRKTAALRDAGAFIAERFVDVPATLRRAMAEHRSAGNSGG